MDLKISNLVFIISMILVGSGIGTGSMALMAVDPDPYHIPVGHVAFGFQRDDGKFVIGSFGPDEGNPLLGFLETQVFDDLKSVKNYFSASGYKTIKGIHVDNIDPTAADNTMNALKESGFVAIQSAYPTEMSSIIMPGTENCLTFAVKVLEAYGADMPAIIPLVTSWPNAYYGALSKLGWIESPVSSQTPSIGKASLSSSQDLGVPLLPSPTSGTGTLSGESNEGSYVSPTTTTTTTRTRVAWTLPGYERVTPGSVSWLPDHYEWARNLNDGEYYSQDGNNYLKTEQYIGIFDHLPYQIVHVGGRFPGSPSIWPPWGEDWVVTSQGSLVAGVGLLIDEGPNGGGGW